MFLTVAGSPRFERRSESDVHDVHRAAKTRKAASEDRMLSPLRRRSEPIIVGSFLTAVTTGPTQLFHHQVSNLWSTGAAYSDVYSSP